MLSRIAKRKNSPVAPDASLALAFSEDDGSLLARLGQGASDGARAWLLNAMAHRLSLVRGFDRLLAWPSLQDVTRYEHQERTALRVLRELRGRAILADEVGLGKTIEAGLILKEYAIRGLVHRALVLAPSGLTTQWREEMQEKFSLPFEVLRSASDPHAPPGRYGPGPPVRPEPAENSATTVHPCLGRGQRRSQHGETLGRG